MGTSLHKVTVWISRIQIHNALKCFFECFQFAGRQRELSLCVYAKRCGVAASPRPDAFATDGA